MAGETLCPNARYRGMAIEEHDESSEPSQALKLPAYVGSDIARCSTLEARALIPLADATAFSVLPLSLLRLEHGVSLHCAATASSYELRQKLRFVSGVEVIITVVEASVIDDAILRAYLGSDALLSARLAKLSLVSAEPARRSAPAPRPQGDAAQFLTALLEFGVGRGASDLHLCPVKSGAVVKIRIDGDLLSQDAQPYSHALHAQVMTRVKALAGLDITCKRLPQDGSFSFDVAGHERSVRVSTLPAVYGESAVLRFLSGRTVRRVDELGLEASVLRGLRAAMRHTQGVILLTGPTGSGKTTTMYAVARELKEAGRNVVTVEDPVESPLGGIVQVQVNEEQGLSYPRAIRSVLRHDPDVILIGEMRDPESARIGLESAATGHLTISSLHVGSALLAIDRLGSLGVARERAVAAVSLVVTQRLMQRLCESCKARDDVASERFGCTVFRPSGCSACGGSGFQGRVVLAEVLNLQDYSAKAVCVNARTTRELLETLPISAWIPWSTSLEAMLRCGAISAEQFERFLDTEMHLV